MFRTSATLVRTPARQGKSLVGGMVAFGVVTAIVMVGSALGGASFQQVIPALIVVFVAGYSVNLSSALVPVREPVELLIDGRGVLAGGALLAARGEIIDAYLRPPTGAIRSHRFSYPAQPMRVEVATTQSSFMLEGRDDAHTMQILAALGVPARMVAADHLAPTAESRQLQHDGQRARWVMVTVMLLMLLVPFGYAAVTFRAMWPRGARLR